MPSFINPPGLYDPRPNGYSHVAIADGMLFEIEATAITPIR
jgi:hypothetical protein